MSYNIEQINSGFMSLTSGALVIGTTAGTFKIAAAVTFTNNGIFKSKAITDNLAFSAGHTALGNSQACLFGLFLDTSGNVTTSQGMIVSAGDPCPVPNAPASNLTPCGLIKVTTSSSQTFTPGTTVLGTSNTAAYTNIASMPGSAQ